VKKGKIWKKMWTNLIITKMRGKVDVSKWNEWMEGDRRGKGKWTDFIINLQMCIIIIKFVQL